jgi:two-component system, NarL family, nitrate/nitrite response regulator NarL
MASSTSRAIRIVLVDDHAVVRSGLRLLVESRSGWIVVAEAGTAAEAVAAASREQPDLILLDLDLGEDRGLDCVPRLRAAAPGARILILTGLRDTEMHQQAIRLGAAGVVVKDTAADSLLKAIERVHAGETWLDRLTTATLLAELAHDSRSKPRDPDQTKIGSLTPREREVVALITEGLRNKEIADRLHISEATVRHHLTAIFSKLDISDRLGLTIYAFKHGLSAPKK